MSYVNVVCSWGGGLMLLVCSPRVVLIEPQHRHLYCHLSYPPALRPLPNNILYEHKSLFYSIFQTKPILQVMRILSNKICIVSV